MKFTGNSFKFLLMGVCSIIFLASVSSAASKFDGPYVREAQIKQLKTLMTLAQTVMPEKTNFPKYSALGLKINVAQGLSSGLCQEVSPDEASDKLLTAIQRAVPKGVWDSIPKLLQAVKGELSALWALGGSEAQLMVCATGGRGQGYLDGEVSMNMSFMIKELTQEESDATFNKRSFDNIQIFYSAVEWEE